MSSHFDLSKHLQLRIWPRDFLSSMSQFDIRNYQASDLQWRMWEPGQHLSGLQIQSGNRPRTVKKNILLLYLTSSVWPNDCKLCDVWDCMIVMVIMANRFLFTTPFIQNESLIRQPCKDTTCTNTNTNTKTHMNKNNNSKLVIYQFTRAFSHSVHF